MKIFEKANYDFIRWRWQALILSALLVLAGIGYGVVRGGIPLGIDFTGGTLVVVRFTQPVAEDAVRKALDSLPGEKVGQKYGDPSANEILIRLPQVSGTERGFSLEQGSQAVESALVKAGLPKFEVTNREVVGPVIGADLQRKGIYATLASLVGITIYIALRFRFTFAIGAI